MSWRASFQIASRNVPGLAVQGTAAAPRGLTAHAIDLGVRCQVFIAIYLAASCAYLSQVVHGAIAWSPVAAMFVLSWQVYAGDRFVIHPEDVSGTDEDLDRLRFLRRHRHMFQALFSGSVVAEALLVAARPRLLWGLVVGAALGALYLVPIPFQGTRLKLIPYAKTLYVPFAAIVTMLLLLGRAPRGDPAILVGGLYFLMVLNTAVFDIKDRENDRLAGIRTLANTLGARPLTRLVQGACLAAGLLLVVLSPRAPAAALALSFWAFTGLLVGLTATTERSGHFYYGLLDVVLALPLLFLCVIRLLR